MFASLREDAVALLEGFDTHQLAAIAQFLTRHGLRLPSRRPAARPGALRRRPQSRRREPDLNHQRGVAMNDDEQLIALFDRMCRA